MQSKNIVDFFSTDVRSFSVYDCHRSIPSGIDGFKPSQRKIIYGMNKQFRGDEVKVSIAASATQSISQYHHGSLEGVMVNMAQSFPGANNVPYLDDIGQFGSRISPSAAASRYIFTRLNENFRRLYLKVDDDILNYCEDDGVSIEPEYYLPVLPTILLNGAEGMGTGFASKILAYHPMDLIDSCVSAIKGKPIADIVPWYRGFNGTITRNGNQTVFTGRYTINNTTTMTITELPIGVFTQRYREVLNDLEDANIIKSYVDNSTEAKTEFVVTCPRDTLKRTHEELIKTFKLSARDTENLTVWTESGKLKKFDSVTDLIRWFVAFRLTKYETRKIHLLKEYETELFELTERREFIRYYLNHTEWFSKTSRKQIVESLTQFTTIASLLNIKIFELTIEEIERLEQNIADISAKIDELNSLSQQDLYLKDIKQVKQHFNSDPSFNR